MSDSDDDMAAAALTPLEMVMETLNGDGERVIPLYNAGCCQSCGHYEGQSCRRDRRARGYVFWHDGCVEEAAIDGVLTLYHRAFSGSRVMSRQVPRRVVRVFEAHGMHADWGGEAHNSIRVELQAVDQEYFEDRFWDMTEAEECANNEWLADAHWRKRLYKAFFEGIRARRDEIEEFTRRRAERVIKDAVMDWMFRPGGVGQAGAKRSFEAVT